MSDLIGIGYEYDGRGLKEQQAAIEKSIKVSDDLSRATNNLSEETDDLTARVKKLDRELTMSKKTMGGLIGGYGQYNKRMDDASVKSTILRANTMKVSNEIDNLGIMFGRASTNADHLTSAANRVGKSSGMLRHQMTNVSYQLQDVAVQAQMGTSAFTILAQQGGQLLSPFSALAGIAATLAGVIGGALFASLRKTKEETQEYKVDIDSLIGSMEKLNRAELFATQKVVEKEVLDLKNQSKAITQEIVDLNLTGYRETIKRAEQQGKSEERIKKYQDAYNEQLGKVQALKLKQKAIDDEILKRAQQLNDVADQTTLSVKGLNDEQRGFYQDSIVAGKRQTEINRSIAEGKRMAGVASREEAQKEAEITADLLDTRRQLTLETNLANAKKSNDYDQIVAARDALILYKAELASVKVSGEIDPRLVEQFNEIFQLKAQLEDPIVITVDAQIGTEIDKLVGEQQKMIGGFMGFLNTNQESLQKYTSNFASTVGTVSDIRTAFTIGKKADDEREVVALNKKRDLLVQELETSTNLSDAQRKEKQAEIARIDRVTKQKEKNLKHEFEVNKKFQLTQIVANTAVEASKVLTNPFAFFGVLAAGAAQLATVSSQQYNSASTLSTTAPNIAPPPSTQSTTNINSAPNISFNVTGGFDQNAVDQVKKFITDGGYLIPPDSENAIALRG